MNQVEWLNRIPERDPELTAVLDRIRNALSEISVLQGPDYDVMLGWVEQMAASEVLSLFHEIERLDAIIEDIRVLCHPCHVDRTP